MTDSSTGRNLLSATILTAGLLLAGYVYFTGQAAPPGNPALADASVSQVGHSAEPTPTRKPIEQIRVGDRVKAYNPEVTAAEREGWQEPDWGDWVKLSLQVAKPNGSYADIELLRPRAWLRENLIFAATRRPCILKPPAGAPSAPRSLIPLHPVYCDLIATVRDFKASGRDVVGLFAHLNLPEFGVQGLAVLIGIEPNVRTEVGEGHVVTGAFTHFSNEVIDLVVEDSTGQPQSIGTTADHPFWSADRLQFIPAGQLEKGENLSTVAGDTHYVISKQPRKGSTQVYNLEVHGEHVYYAGEDGMLVHNMCDGMGRVPRNNDEFLTFFHGTSKSNAESIRKGIDPKYFDPRNDFGAGFYLSSSRDVALTRAKQVFPDEPVEILEFMIRRSDYESLRKLDFDGPNAAWRDFVLMNRRYTPHLLSGGNPVDVVSGPMWKKLSPSRFGSDGRTVANWPWPSEPQISIHTERAIRLFNEGLVK